MHTESISSSWRSTHTYSAPYPNTIITSLELKIISVWIVFSSLQASKNNILAKNRWFFIFKFLKCFLSQECIWCLISSKSWMNEVSSRFRRLSIRKDIARKKSNKFKEKNFSFFFWVLQSNISKKNPKILRLFKQNQVGISSELNYQLNFHIDNDIFPMTHLNRILLTSFSINFNLLLSHFRFSMHTSSYVAMFCFSSQLYYQKRKCEIISLSQLDDF